MTTEFPPDPFDTDLQTLFAGVHPAAGFEDRLVNAVRQHRRLRLAIPAPVARAALAAAAVLAVGMTGYFGNRAMTGGAISRAIALRTASSEPIAALAARDAADEIVSSSQYYAYKTTPTGAVSGSSISNSATDKWDFGGGSNSAKNWVNWNGDQQNLSDSYEDPFATHKANSDGWQLKNPHTMVASDASRARKSSPSDSLDNVLLPHAETDGAEDEKVAMRDKGGPSPLAGKFASTDLGIHGYNTYTRGTTVSGGTLSMGTSATPLRDAITANNPAPNLAFKVSDLPAEDDQKVPLSAPDGSGVGRTERKGQTSDLVVQRRAAFILDRNPITSNQDEKGGKGRQSPLSPAPPSSTPKLTSLVAGDPSVDDPAITFATGDQQGQKGGQVPLSAPPITPTTATTATTQPAAVIDDRKIIRTGTMEFDVDRFDTAQMQISKIVLELGGFVGATDSTKLPNGKVRGSISVRVPPERLDVLVLSLRALGDLKSQQIVASDITKEYTDIESELAADRAMQDRLLELIHNGKGAVKDLLAAENELGNWRAKIEKAEGMIRYYNGQVGLSTLVITLSERDIQTPATAIETETADVGIEADDVEKARNAALKAIDDVKGRIVEAELKRFDAGQLAARLVADVPPESAGAVIDQLKLLGKVARLEVNRQQSTSDGTSAVTAVTPLKTERKPTRLLVSIYNLANVAPRRTTNVSLAATDVEAAYTALASAAKSNGGRIVTSSLDRGDPIKATGSLVLEFPPDKFESAMTALRAQGDVLKLTLTENPDTQNSTEAKQGLTVQLVALAAVPARESIQQTLAASDVPSAYQAVLDAVNAAHARVQSAQLNEQDRQNISADLQVEIPRTEQAEFDKALASAGGTIARTSTQSAQAEGTVDSKLQLHLLITSADHLAPRETTKLQVEVPDVDKSAADAQTVAIAAGGRVVEATVSKDHGKGLARLILDLPLDKAGDILRQLRAAGTVRGIDASRDPKAPTGPLAHAQVFIEFVTTEAIVADQTGPWASIRQGLSTSITGLLWSLQWVVVGLCLIVPWAGIAWIGWKLRSRIRRTKFEHLR